MTQPTSAIAYRGISEDGTLGKQQQAVIDCLTLASDPMTSAEIEYRTNIRAHKRMRELAQINLVTEAGQRKCTITGRLAITWKLSTEDEYGQQKLF